MSWDRTAGQNALHRGPVWVTKGEHLSPTGPYNYCLIVSREIRKHLQVKTDYLKQLKCASPDHPKRVRTKSILSLTSTELEAEIHKLEADSNPGLVIKTDLEIDKKLYGPDKVKSAWPYAPKIQFFSINRHGQICPAPFVNQLALGIKATASQVMCRVGLTQLPGIRVELVTKGTENEDLFQCWSFGADGYVRNHGNPTLALCFLDKKCIEDEGNTNKWRLMAVEIGNVEPPPNFRWGIKQEAFATMGQWRHNEVLNPEWHRLALTWPVDRQGRWLEKLSWPLTGYLMASCPPIGPRKCSWGSNQPAAVPPKRLMVLPNGEPNLARGHYLTGPDVTKLSRRETRGGLEENQADAAIHCQSVGIEKLEFNLVCFPQNSFHYLPDLTNPCSISMVRHFYGQC
ncbi:doublecortin domain containing 5 [Cichlidogyrus casuarinus]|uniref:Doublecortin domain containing 5 n=1 Tax=Cichlidogyrus casuarinus TaxID=1844966 RepID=A0ABD2QAG1_9PLAT